MASTRCQKWFLRSLFFLSFFLYAENYFTDRVFYVIIANADTGNLVLMVLLTCTMYLDHMLLKFEQHRLVHLYKKF